MKIGDKVVVTYADGDQFVGRIVGETEKMWKMDFDGEDEIRKVRKSLDIQLVDDPETPEPEVAPVEEVEVPTDEEFEAPMEEPKKKWGLVIMASIILGGLVALITLKLLGAL